jgi:nucleotide-binding universal stress UspA family protein
MVPKTVVVPLDGSDVAARALPVATSLATGLGADLLLMTTTQTRRSDRMLRPVWLDDAATGVAGPTVTTRLVDEHPADAAILSVAREATDATVCMATHGRGALGTAILGSVAQDVVRAADLPVVLVGPHVYDPKGEPWSGLEQPMVVCHDGSVAADAIVPIACEWARTLAVPVVVVHVFHPLDVESASHPTAAIDPMLEAMRCELDDVDVRIYRDSFPVGVILELLRTLPASLVALSTHGRTGLARATLGSVAASLVHASPCPVLLTRPAQLR